ncbi:hypothetical protein GCM10027037_26820 [Mucilaginibacter koreensis]
MPNLIQKFTLLTLFLILGFVHLCHAGIEPYYNYKYGPFAKDSALTVKDEKFQNSNYNWLAITNSTVKNSVTLRVVDSVLINYQFTYTLNVKIDTYSDPNPAVAPTSVTVPLTVNYIPGQGSTYKSVDSYAFTGAYKVVVTVMSVNTNGGAAPAPQMVQLSSSIVIDRHYQFQPQAVIAPVYAVNNHMLAINWGAVAGAEEYDIEWTTLNNGNDNFTATQNIYNGTLSVDDATYNSVANQLFRNNASRITTSGNQYLLSTISTDDYLLARIRQVQYTADGLRLTGNWNYKQLNGKYAIVKIEDPSPDFNLNWQYSAAYAEDGKKKEVISYFDGTLRGRQTVTINNTDNIALVQENVYDEIGRAAASILPAPVKEANPYLRYISNFNLNTSGKAYNAQNLNNIGANCEILPGQLSSSTSGAAWYYSANNTFKSSNYLYNYLPDASGYPLSVTQYTPDNTGRIKLQGGVGPNYQPGSGSAADPSKTTKYYYGKPEQWEIDRLFGNDVGYAEHYLKNVVVDPNNQISISYLNASGKTIATSLAGKNPANQDALPSYTAAESNKTLNLKVISPDKFTYNSTELKLSAVTTYLASVTGNDVLTFNMKKLTSTYPNPALQICSNCYYEMKLQVTNDCGELVAGSAAVVKMGSDGTVCGYSGDETPQQFTIPINKIGEYNISIELALNSDVIQKLSDNFVQQATAKGYLEQEFNYIKTRYLNDIDVSGCYADCHTCTMQLSGGQADFITSIRKKFLALDVNAGSVNSGDFDTWAGTLYNSLKAKCDQMQAGCKSSPCADLKNDMMLDVSPGGQYALFDTNGSALEISINALAKLRPDGTENWRYRFPPKASTDPDYQNNLVTLEDGSQSSPYDANFKLALLIQYWKPEWAERFLPDHPEYCKLTFCEANSDYFSWDEDVKNDINSAADVIKIRSATPLNYASTNNSDWLLNADKFFTQSGAPGYQYQSQMRADLLSYSSSFLHFPVSADYPVKSLMQFNDYVLYCSAPGNININGNPSWNCSPDNTCRVPDREWQAYRDAYFDLKQKYVVLARNAVCGNSCPIGPPLVYNVPGIAPPSGTTTNYYVTIVDEADPTPLSTEPGCPRTIYQPRRTRLIVKDSNGNIITGANVTVKLSYTRYGGQSASNPGTITNSSIDVTPSSPLQYIGFTNFDCEHAYYKMTLDCIKGITGAFFQQVSTDNGASISFCSGYVSTPPPAYVAPSNNCPPEYANKTPRVIDQPSTSVTSISQDQSAQLNEAAKALIVQNVGETCAANADAWMQRLQAGLDSRGIDNYTRNLLRQRLVGVCISGGDIDHPMGASTSSPSVSPQPAYTSFGSAIKGVLQLPAYTMDLNPWLIDGPSPYTTKNQWAPVSIANSNPSICNLLATLTSRASAAQGNTSTPDIYAYLVNTYQEAMTMSREDLAVLQRSCTRCQFLTERNVTLPVFLDPSNQGVITKTDYAQALAALSADFGNQLNTAHANYSEILSNYMNQRFGFALSYDQYQAFAAKTDPNAILANIPPYTSVAIDPYSCVKELLETAVNNGKASYAEYIANERAKFKADYINTCKQAQASATLQTTQRIYHHTLYYYDQADNLVRTVPPEGVQLLSDAETQWVQDARGFDASVCEAGYAGAQPVVDNTAAFNALSTALAAGGNHAIEFWLYTQSKNANQLLVTTPDRKYMLQMCISGGLLNVDVYSLQPGAPANTGQFILSNHVTGNISSLVPLRPWVHVVIQGAGLATGSPIALYLNGTYITPISNGMRAGCDWQVNGASGPVKAPDNLATIKHMRIYNRLMDAAGEIVINANNNCFYPAQPDMAWFRFNVPNPGGPTTIAAGSTKETRISPIYPDHGLMTTYSYNSTNQVVSQTTPDGGTNRYWYDLLSRLVASQNDKQQPDNNYSYTKYDVLGRITEVGQKQQNTINLGSPDYLPHGAISGFLIVGTNSQITQTWYDQATTGNGMVPVPGQDNLRKRVAASTYRETAAGPVLNATYYNYDLDGNVKTLWQQIGGLYKTGDAEPKRIDYEYDLVSGKVNFVRYQQNATDQFYYAYKYDAENRLTEAWSGTQALISPYTGSSLLADNRRLDASYRYYLHGPLARVELGDVRGKVQGIDYAYTLQGWLKGVNSTAVITAKDMGGDGAALHPTIARDAYGYNLYYNSNDYSPVAAGTPPFETQLPGQAAFSPLYNGNIAGASVNVPKLGAQWNNYLYRYDQLNRLTALTVLRQSQAGGSLTLSAEHNEGFTYDGNGNILTAYRNGTATGSPLAMDNLSYSYNRDQFGRLQNNKLNYLTDQVPAGNYNTDLDSQLPDNYKYDNIGNLTQDVQAGLTSVDWTVYGKIRSITNSAGTLNYSYDAGGNRVSKATSSLSTYYVRDAQGNPLAVYETAGGTTTWREQQLYGSSRLGLWQPNVNLANGNNNVSWNTLGNKRYELTNHLGNVLATITDRRLQHTSNNSTVDYYDAEVTSAQDYYAFGALQPGRQISSDAYRYGFNGKENDNDAGKGLGNEQDYGMRIYDPRVGRFLSVDPLMPKYPELTPYQFASNRPIDGVDLEGLEWAPPMKFDKKTGKSVVDADAATAIHTSKANLIGPVLLIDIYVTKGWLSRMLIASELASAFNHNRATTAEGRIKQDKESWQHIGNAALGEATGYLFGRFFTAGKDLFKITEIKAANTLFRGDTRSPVEIFKSGFEAKGTGTDVIDYVEVNTPSVFIGTSKSSVQAAKKAKDGYLYIVDDTGKGINVNNYYKALEGRENPYFQEQEIIFDTKIPNSQIKGAYQIKDGKINTKNFIVNPAYKQANPN